MTNYFSPRFCSFRYHQRLAFLVIVLLMLVASTAPVLAHEPGHPDNQGFISPVTRSTSPGQVLKAFDRPEKNWLPGHRGVDLSASVGDQIFAAGPGTVLYVGTIAGTPVVSIEHQGDLRTTYQPVFAHVTIGDQVAAGDVIGTLAPNKAGEAGLHWGAKYGAEDYINPLSLLPRPIIRLKPL